MSTLLCLTEVAHSALRQCLSQVLLSYCAQVISLFFVFSVACEHILFPISDVLFSFSLVIICFCVLFGVIE